MLGSKTCYMRDLNMVAVKKYTRGMMVTFQSYSNKAQGQCLG